MASHPPLAASGSPCTTPTPTASTCPPTPLPRRPPPTCGSPSSRPTPPSTAPPRAPHARRRVDRRFPGCLAAAADHRRCDRHLHRPARDRLHDRRHTGAAAAIAEAAPSSALPLPIEYQLAAIDDLGEALLSSAGVDPATALFGAPYAENVGAALDDGARSDRKWRAPGRGPFAGAARRARRRRLVAGVGLTSDAVDGRSTGLDRRRRLVPPDRPCRTDVCGRRVRDRQPNRRRDRAGGDAEPGPPPRRPPPSRRSRNWPTRGSSSRHAIPEPTPRPSRSRATSTPSSTASLTRLAG